MFVFQTPYTFEQLTGVPRSDNAPWAPTDSNINGGFNLNGDWFTQLNNQEQGIEAAIKPKYKNFFRLQRKVYDHLSFDTALQKINLQHPFVKVLYQKRLTYINRGTFQRKFRFNKLIPMSTTWKFPYMVHDGKIEEGCANFPDRKVYVMFIATPIFGGIEDPGQNMHGLELAANIDENEPQRRFERFGSHVDERFVDNPPEPEEMDVGSQGPTTRSKGKQREQDAGPAEVRKSKAKIETNEYGWAYNQTIMIRPTFEIWWKNMPLKRVGYR
jgi:hypothetical protein